jgi:hypothetical protein
MKLNMKKSAVHVIFFVSFISSIFSAFLIGLTANQAQAHSHHTESACSNELTDVCAHLGYNVEPNPSDPWIFMLHFQSPNLDPSQLKQVSVSLWMDMGHHSHGSSPVTVSEKTPTHFLVQDAFFPMSGAWQVKVSFLYQGKNGDLIVPIMVQ